MKDSERLKWEAKRVKEQIDPEALKAALSPKNYLTDSNCTYIGPPTPYDRRKMSPAELEAYDLQRTYRELISKAGWAVRREKQERRAEFRRIGMANRDQGSRWEGIVLRFFKELGFNAFRVDESHGYNRGRDIAVKERPGMIIQCKATKTKAALLNGLNEAREHNPKALCWVCFHQYRVKKKGKYEYRVAYTTSRTGPPSITDLRGFFHVLQTETYPG